MEELTEKKRIVADNLYLILSGIFIASLIASNLIFQKFFSWSPFGLYTFELSVGILPYPITFLVTDIISEIYGRRKANRLVLSGLFASIFVLLIIVIADRAEATSWSPIGNSTFKSVFGFTYIAVASSMIAYLIAQFIDVQLFHFWKRITKGKHLWLRNNASTFTSQFIDTFTVLLLLCSFGVIEWNLFTKLLLNGFIFKLIIAILDTPVIYTIVYFMRRYFNLKSATEELTY